MRHITKPEVFLGNLKSKKYFEGWYFKLLSLKNHSQLALIPGVSLNPKDSHAFIQVFYTKFGNSPKMETYYLRYPLSSFSYDKHQFKVQIGDSIFTKDQITLDINHDIKLNGMVQLSNHQNIKKNLYQPTIMGPFTYAPLMECYHGILSMKNELIGSLHLNQQEIDFNNSFGYIEKDWGRSFPREYIWLQANQFHDPFISFMASYAIIPFIGFHFKGLIVSLFYQHKEHRFATYNFTKTKINELEHNKVHLTLKKRGYKLEISAKIDQLVELVSPQNGMMNQKIKEGLNGKISLKLYHKKQLILEDESNYAGIEIMMKKP